MSQTGQFDKYTQTTGTEFVKIVIWVALSLLGAT